MPKISSVPSKTKKITMIYLNQLSAMREDITVCTHKIQKYDDGNAGKKMSPFFLKCLGTYEYEKEFSIRVE